jgi:mannose-6-phosphate isomerase-like protein (cupin superfamily)
VVAGPFTSAAWLEEMLIRDIDECDPVAAGDGSTLRELLNPLKEDLDIRYSLAEARVRAGESTRAHQLKSAEVYYIVAGVGEMRIEDETAAVRSGQAVYIPPGATQSIRNTGDADLVFLCLVDPAWQPEDETILE